MYDMIIHMMKIPFLEPHCPKEAKVSQIRTSDIMSTNVKTLRPVERVGVVYNLLATTTHSCFPLVTGEDECGVFGSVLRETLSALLHLKAFSSTTEVDLLSPALQSPLVAFHKIERYFPNYPSVHNLFLR